MEKRRGEDGRDRSAANERSAAHSVILVLLLISASHNPGHRHWVHCKCWATDTTSASPFTAANISALKQTEGYHGEITRQTLGVYRPVSLNRLVSAHPSPLTSYDRTDRKNTSTIPAATASSKTAKSSTHRSTTAVSVHPSRRSSSELILPRV